MKTHLDFGCRAAALGSRPYPGIAVDAGHARDGIVAGILHGNSALTAPVEIDQWFIWMVVMTTSAPANSTLNFSSGVMRRNRPAVMSS